MNIVFFHQNGINPKAGGISRITFNLITELNKRKDIKAYAIGLLTNEEGEYAQWQFFLPSKSLDTEANIRYIATFVEQKDINILVNQAALNLKTVYFFSKVHSQCCSIKIVSCIHNSVLTQIKNYPFQIEHRLLMKKQKLAFNFLRNGLCRSLLEFISIIMRHKQYLRLAQSSDTIVMLSPGHRKEMTRMLLGRFSQKVIYIPNCILDIEQIAFPKENIILWIGTVDLSVKRIDFMLDVWEQFDSKRNGWKLLVLGDGPALDWAKEQVEARDIQRIEFLGRVTPEPYYAKARISCVTSSHEAFSMVILESLANGVVPVVNNCFPSASYLIKSGVDGSLVKEFDRNDFVRQLVKLTSNDSYLNGMAENCLIEARKYKTSVVCDQWINMFHQLLSK